MTTTWSEIRDALADQIGTLVPAIQTRARTPLAINEDDIAIVEIGQGGIVPATHSSRVDIPIRVIIIASRSTVTESEEALDEYIWPAGDKSVIAAVNADRTLGGLIDDIIWQSSATPYGTPDNMPSARQSEVAFLCTVRAEGDSMVVPSKLIHVRKTIAFDGTANNGASGDDVLVFTVAGSIRLAEVYAKTSEDLVSGDPGNDVLAFGTLHNRSLIFNSTILNITDGVPAPAYIGPQNTEDAGQSMVSTQMKIVDGNLILGVFGSDITDGTIVFDLYYLQGPTGGSAS